MNPTNIAVPADGRFVAMACVDPESRPETAGFDARIEIWSTVPLEPGHTIDRRTETLWNVPVDVSRDGRWVCSVSADDRLEVHEAETGRRHRSYPLAGSSKPGFTGLVRFSHDGSRVLAGGHEGYEVWEVESGRRVVRFRFDSTDEADRRLRWSSGKGPAARGFETSVGSRYLREVAVSGDLKRVLLNFGELVQVRRTNDGHPIREFRIPDERGRRGATLSTDGTTIAITRGHDQEAIHVHDVSTGTLLHDFRADLLRYGQVHFSRVSDHVLAPTTDGWSAWNLRSRARWEFNETVPR